ncbi:MAG: hypothetical protein ACXVW1_10535 [Nocardioides sp.]
MSAGAHDDENPFAGQGSVLLDIGGDVGALVVTMPATLVGEEVEVVREGELHHHGHDHDHGHGHGHEHHHRPHVAVVSRPVAGEEVPSLVFPELVEGRYLLVPKGTDDVRLTVDVTGGRVATATWPA